MLGEQFLQFTDEFNLVFLERRVEVYLSFALLVFDHNKYLIFWDIWLNLPLHLRLNAYGGGFSPSSWNFFK